MKIKASIAILSFLLVSGCSMHFLHPEPNGEISYLISPMTVERNELVGVEITAPCPYSYFVDYILIHGFPMTIILENGYPGENADKKVMTINSISEIPKESVPVECPKSKHAQYKKCWFIKYVKENKK